MVFITLYAAVRTDTADGRLGRIDIVKLDLPIMVMRFYVRHIIRTAPIRVDRDISGDADRHARRTNYLGIAIDELPVDTRFNAVRERTQRQRIICIERCFHRRHHRINVVPHVEGNGNRRAENGLAVERADSDIGIVTAEIQGSSPAV